MLWGNSVSSLSKDLMDGRVGPGTEQKTPFYKLTGQRRVSSVPFMLLLKSYISTIHTTTEIISVVNGAENKWAGVEEDLYYKPLN